MTIRRTAAGLEKQKTPGAIGLPGVISLIRCVARCGYGGYGELHRLYYGVAQCKPNGDESGDLRAATTESVTLVVETVTNLDQDFTRVQVVRPAESEAVIQQDAAICDVDPLDVYGEIFAEAFADREVKGCVG